MTVDDPLFRVRVTRPESTMSDRVAADRKARSYYGVLRHRWLGSRLTRTNHVIHYYAQDPRP